MHNSAAADALDRLAALLEAQHANPFRVAAWRTAAAKVRQHAAPLADVAAGRGLEGLQAELGVGPGTAAALLELLMSGRLRLLDRVEGQVAPEDLFLTVPGVGPTLAHNLHARLGVDTLEGLEAAAADGRLKRVPGFGPRRIAMVREAVAGLLEHSMRRAYRRGDEPSAPHPPPSEATLLAVDAEYRARAAAGKLHCIAPTRFNPEHAAWLPVLHTELDGFSFTALYSNSSLAHRLGRTRDWVVIYFERDGHESQCTVVTETRGPQAGLRVVRGDDFTRSERRHALAG